MTQESDAGDYECHVTSEGEEDEEEVRQSAVVQLDVGGYHHFMFILW